MKSNFLACLCVALAFPATDVVSFAGGCPNCANGVCTIRAVEATVASPALANAATVPPTCAEMADYSGKCGRPAIVGGAIRAAGRAAIGSVVRVKRLCFRSVVFAANCPHPGPDHFAAPAKGRGENAKERRMDFLNSKSGRWSAETWASAACSRWCCWRCSPAGRCTSFARDSAGAVRAGVLRRCEGGRHALPGETHANAGTPGGGRRRKPRVSQAAGGHLPDDAPDAHRSCRRVQSDRHPQPPLTGWTALGEIGQKVGADVGRHVEAAKNRLTA